MPNFSLSFCSLNLLVLILLIVDRHQIVPFYFEVGFLYVITVTKSPSTFFCYDVKENND